MRTNFTPRYLLSFFFTLLLGFVSSSSFAQDAFMGYNYSTTSVPRAWSGTATTFNAGTSKEIVFSNSGAAQIKTATVAGTSNVQHFELGGSGQYVEMSFPSLNPGDQITIRFTGSSNSTSANTAKGGVVYSSSASFDLNNIIGGDETIYLPASNGAWTDINVTPPAGTKSLRLYRRIYYWASTNTASESSGSSTGRVQLGLGVTIRLASMAAWITSAGNPPIVTTTPATAISINSAQSGGDVTAQGDQPVTDRGVVWGTAIEPTIALTTKTSDGSGTGVFSSSIQALTPNSKYYYRAYATSSIATVYGAENNFTTLPAAPISAPANNITLTGFNANWTAPTQGAEAFTYKLEYSTDNTFTTGVTTVSSIASTNLSQAVSGLTSGATYYYRISAENVTGSSAVSSAQTVVLVDGSLATDHFRSVASGNWNAASTWESSHDGTTWTSATSGPDENATAISIRSGHIITVTATGEAQAMTVEAGGELIINPSQTFTIANGTGTDITVNGTVKNMGTFTLAASATMNVGSTGVYEDAQPATSGTITIPTATWASGSTFILSGLVGVSGSDYANLQGVKQTFSNFKINTPNLVTKLLLTRNGGTSAPYMQIAGTLTVDATGTGTGVQILSSGNNNNNLTVGSYVQNGGNVQSLHNASGAANRSFTVLGNFTLNNNSVFDIANTTGTNAGNVTYTYVGGNLSVAPTATLQRTQAAAGPVTALVFNGTAAQTATFGLTNGLLNYTVNNAAGVSLISDLTVNGTLTLTNGHIITANNKVILSSTGSISGAGTNGWIQGSLQKNIATGATASTFEIGDAAAYKPVLVSFGNVSTAGDLIASISQTAGDHPDIANSGIDAAKSVNRFWTITNSGVVFDNYSLVLNFDAADFDAGANPVDFVIKKLDGTTWSTPTTGSKSATSIMATGLTSFSQFAVGEAATLPVTISSFKGEQAGAVNKLLWTTSTEVNNAGFEVEKSVDGKNFSKVHFVATKGDRGNSSSSLSYSFYDKAPVAGNNYYRLKQVDNDGKYNYTPVVIISRKTDKVSLTKVYPTLSSSEVRVLISSDKGMNATIVVADLSGKVVMQLPVQLQAGENQRQLRIANLSSGNYVVKLTCATGCETEAMRFTKQ